ncbi:plastocyanin/azurin family copper-binding protein [Pacificoceanicola onchidii]|uniref:plastocyanin/azurin family copper-binding protein n=1 Tax=Pacificoceanicola onchidii TaxID=2562685 RepID=UPI001F0E6F08|nr:plastocyanin/azurin family copper-binding protein [Pacificoceanicola onchidii]
MTKLITRRTALITLSAAGASLLAAPSIVRAATTHEIQMLNKHPEDKKMRNIFMPHLAVVEQGDTINFVATDRGHNSASGKGQIPEGAEAWNGKVSKDISVTIDVPGFYGYVCTPHASIGMVGLVICKGEGMMDNMDAVRNAKQKGKSRKIWEKIWEEVDALDLTA